MDIRRRINLSQRVRRYFYGHERSVLSLYGSSRALRAPKRALIFADALGPTVQINFLRPLETDPIAEAAAWGYWIVTEGGSAPQTAADLARLERDLDRVVTRFRPTLLVASRYAGALTAKILELQRRVPLLVHLDDNLFEVTAENGARSAEKHADAARQQRLAQLLKSADVDYLSTDALRQQLAAAGVLADRVMIAAIPGAADPIPNPVALGEGPVTFGYMGSRSHAGDLDSIAPAVAAILDRFPTAQFELFGSIEVPQRLVQYDIVRHPRIRTYNKFLENLGTLNWQFGLAPLVENRFSCAKTCVKWIEYAAAGIPVVASDHPVYQKPCADGAGLLVQPDHWEAALASLIEVPARRQALRDAATQKLTACYSPVLLRQQVLAVFDAALAREAA